MEIANASLLDEATAAAEAMAMAREIKPGDAFFVADDCHPQTIELLAHPCRAARHSDIIGDIEKFTDEPVFGALIQSPASDGVIVGSARSDWARTCRRSSGRGASRFAGAPR